MAALAAGTAVVTLAPPPAHANNAKARVMASKQTTAPVEVHNGPGPGKGLERITLRHPIPRRLRPIDSREEGFKLNASKCEL